MLLYCYSHTWTLYPPPHNLTLASRAAARPHKLQTVITLVSLYWRLPPRQIAWFYKTPPVGIINAGGLHQRPPLRAFGGDALPITAQTSHDAHTTFFDSESIDEKRGEGYIGGLRAECTRVVKRRDHTRAAHEQALCSVALSLTAVACGPIYSVRVVAIKVMTRMAQMAAIFRRVDGYRRQVYRLILWYPTSTHTHTHTHTLSE